MENNYRWRRMSHGGSMITADDSSVPSVRVTAALKVPRRRDPTRASLRRDFRLLYSEPQTEATNRGHRSRSSDVCLLTENSDVC
eukprot:scaffold17519_cov44-Phaeocystis_antarctica.AAC.1